jgi:hypothetical protein
MSPPTDAIFVARCRECRRIVAAALDNDRLVSVTEADIAQWVRRGDVVERVVVSGGVRVEGCACHLRNAASRGPSPQRPPK